MCDLDSGKFYSQWGEPPSPFNVDSIVNLTD